MRRVARCAGVDGNPLRRGIDRMERAIWTLIIIGFAVAAPLLVPMAGHLARTDSLRLVRLEGSWREVSAVLLKPAPRQVNGYNSAMSVWAPGRWRSPAGAQRTGLVPANPGTPAGTVVKIWVDRAGQLTGARPFTAGLVGFRIVTTEILATAGLALLAVLLAIGVRCLMNRRRMTYWTIEWALFGPRWSARH